MTAFTTHADHVLVRTLVELQKSQGVLGLLLLVAHCTLISIAPFYWLQSECLKYLVDWRFRARKWDV